MGFVNWVDVSPYVIGAMNDNYFQEFPDLKLRAVRKHTNKRP